MTADPFAALPRYSLIDGNMTRATSGDYVHVSDLAALAAAVPDDLAEAGKVLEGVTLAIDEDDDAYLVPSGAEGNLVALPARNDDYAVQHPEIWQAMVERFNAYPALIALATAQEAQIAGLEEAIDANWITHQRVVAAEAALAAMTKERDELAERNKENSRLAEDNAQGLKEAETALAAERAKTAKLVEAARDAEYDLLQWLECGEHLTKAGFNMDGTPEVVRNLTAALREFQEKSDAEA